LETRKQSKFGLSHLLVSNGGKGSVFCIGDRVRNSGFSTSPPLLFSFKVEATKDLNAYAVEFPIFDNVSQIRVKECIETLLFCKVLREIEMLPDVLLARFR